jgi:hypothetical protein
MLKQNTSRAAADVAKYTTEDSFGLLKQHVALWYALVVTVTTMMMGDTMCDACFT